MSFLRMSWSENPARFVSRLLALVPLVFALLTSFGVVFTGDQQEAIAGVLYGLAALFGLGGEVIRSQVTPTSNTTTVDSLIGHTPAPYDPIPKGHPQRGATNLSLVVGILVGVVVILAIIVLV